MTPEDRDLILSQFQAVLVLLEQLVEHDEEGYNLQDIWAAERRIRKALS